VKRLLIALVINNWDFFVKRGTPNPILPPNLNPKKKREKRKILLFLPSTKEKEKGPPKEK
jgi:hypothetical protein